MVSMRGAYCERSVRGPSSTASILSSRKRRPRFGLLHRLLQDLAGKAADLDVHLKGGNSLARSGNLEVHIAVVIFCAGNVGEDGVVVAFLHQAHRHAGNRTLERDARVVERQARAANRSHRGRTVRLENVRDDADRVWRLFGTRAARRRWPAPPSAP